MILGALKYDREYYCHRSHILRRSSGDGNGKHTVSDQNYEREKSSFHEKNNVGKFMQLLYLMMTYI